MKSHTVSMHELTKSSSAQNKVKDQSRVVNISTSVVVQNVHFFQSPSILLMETKSFNQQFVFPQIIMKPQNSDCFSENIFVFDPFPTS